MHPKPFPSMDLLEPWRNAPPARYTLESDSEDEQDPEDLYRPPAASASSSSSSRPEPKVEFRASAASNGKAELPPSGRSVIVAIADAGKAWTEGLDEQQLQEASEVLVNDKKVASISTVQETNVVFLAGSFSYEEQHSVAEELLERLEPTDVTVLDSYSVQTYLAASSPTPSIRYLATEAFQSTSTLKLEAFEPPNLVAGLAAALVGEAAERDLPCLLLLLPSQHGDPTSHNSTLQHAASRQSTVPESIYDYGGPSPYAASLLASPENLAALRRLSDGLQWQTRIAWQVPSKEKLSSIGKLKGRRDGAGRGATTTKLDSSQAGFGWLREERRLGEREIGEGGMYM